jgi:hypothetical protein
MDVEKTAGVIDVLKGMSSKELAVTLLLIIGAVGVAFWVENRYAKLVDTQARIEQQQQQLIQLQTQILNVVNALPSEVRREIVERSQAAQALNKSNREFIPPK